MADTLRVKCPACSGRGWHAETVRVLGQFSDEPRARDICVPCRQCQGRRSILVEPIMEDDDD